MTAGIIFSGAILGMMASVPFFVLVFVWVERQVEKDVNARREAAIAANEAREEARILQSDQEPLI